MEDYLKNFKMDCLSNHWADLDKMLNLSSLATQAMLKMAPMEDITEIWPQKHKNWLS